MHIALREFIDLPESWLSIVDFRNIQTKQALNAVRCKHRSIIASARNLKVLRMKVYPRDMRSRGI